MKSLWHLNSAVVANNTIMPYLVTTLSRSQSAISANFGLELSNSGDRCWLQGALGDALHALSCAAGYNLRWVLRAIACLGACLRTWTCRGHPPDATVSLGAIPSNGRT